MSKTVVVGSPEDRKARIEKIDAVIDCAKLMVSDEGAFTPDQAQLLKAAFRSIGTAIKFAI